MVSDEYQNSTITPLNAIYDSIKNSEHLKGNPRLIETIAIQAGMTAERKLKDSGLEN